ncbi:MAG: type I restriction enzyme HsdR N-terminal domain-containing protein [Coriobacteriia bacterium]
MAVYQDKAKERISRGLRKFRGIVDRARAANANESDTRMIVSSVIADLLGWDPFTNLTGEYRIKGTYADFCLKNDGEYLAVIEVKAIGTKLSTKHVYQAVTYAANEGIDWVILTNGDDWNLYRVVFGKPITQDIVFEVSLSDDEMKPKAKSDLLYLLSAEAQRKNELQGYYDKKAALCGFSVAKVLLGVPMLTKLRSEMRSSTGYRLGLDELATILVEDVFRPEVQGGETARLIKKAAAAKNG